MTIFKKSKIEIFKVDFLFELCICENVFDAYLQRFVQKCNIHNVMNGGKRYLCIKQKPYVVGIVCIHKITDADYTNDIAHLANTPAQAKTLLYSLERAAAGIGLYVNANKMEYMCFNQRGDISTLNDSSLKLVDKFTYLGSSVSSTEIDINI